MWVKQIALSFLAMGFLWSIAPVTPQGHTALAGTTTQAITPPPVIRFRVIANSDNPVDQAVKLDVRDRVLAVLDPLLTHVHDKEQAAAILSHHIAQVTEAADAVLAAHHVTYHTHVRLTTTEFPTKAYGSWVLPAGRYEALLVVLGHGAGHNWWCVLFPSLCFIDMSNAVAIPAAAAMQTSPANPVTVPAVPVKLPPPVPHHPHGAIHVSWRLPHIVNHLLAWF
ncbi:MAG: stage II sporulation protein R [Sulfobacillus thermosulfidooxidans]|nr:MAG: stage II sporulation protein R [Sulfobacillus thermosulfidooxidans]